MNLEEHLIGRSLDFKRAKGKTLIFEARILEDSRHPYMMACIAGLMTLAAVIGIHLTQPGGGTFLAVMAVTPSAVYFTYRFMMCLAAYRRLKVDMHENILTISESSGAFGSVDKCLSLSQIRVIYADELGESVNVDYTPTICLSWKDPETHGEFLNIEFGNDRQKFISWLRDHQVPVLPSSALILEDAEGE